MGTKDDQMHAVGSAAMEYLKAWKDLRRDVIAPDQKGILEGRRATREQALRDAVDALLS